MTDVNERRRGRPEKFPGEGPRIGYALRLKASVDKRIRPSAEANCRTLSEELEYRINSTVEGIVLFAETPDLRKALQVSAKQNGRSVAVEAEARLVESFEQDRIFGRPETHALLAMLAKDIGRIEQDLGLSWLDAGEQPNNTVAEDLIATFSERILWEMSLRDRMRARARSHREQPASASKPAAQAASPEPIAEEPAPVEPTPPARRKRAKV